MNTKWKKAISTIVMGSVLLGSTVVPSFGLSVRGTPNLGMTTKLNMQLTSTAASNEAVGKVSFGNAKTTVDTFNGVPAYYKIGNHNTDTTYSCAAYVKRYYSQIFGVGVYNLLTGATPTCSNSGYSFKQVNARNAKPGDIGYHTNSSGSGHWFIIKAVGSSGLTVIEQNYKNPSSTSVSINRVVSYSQGGLRTFRLYRNGVDMNGGGTSNQPAPSNNGGSGLSSYNSGSLEQLLFNAEMYYAMYPDLQAAFGKDSQKLENHWRTCGIKEGRIGSAYFDAKFYLAANPDVAKAYGSSNYAGAYSHFVNHGFGEGRQGSPVFSVRYYVDKYSDLKKAFGTNWLAAAWHFKTNGTGEGRQGASNFSVTDYANLNTDVKKAFSSNEEYIRHYLQYGRNEGRATTAQGGGASASAGTSSRKNYSGTYAIKTAVGHCINVQYASTVSDQAKVVVDPWNHQNNEIFVITKVGNYYRISPKHAGNLALNAQYGKDAKTGQQLSLHTWENGDDASLWSIEEVSGGVRFRNKANPKLVMDVDSGRRTVVGARINLWTDANTGNQSFTLQRV